MPPDYRRHFRSFDGKQRSFVVEGVGGPSWFTEYNVLTGLSARSYGRFADFVTRIAAGRVERGLPQALRTLRLQDLQPLSVHGRLPGRAPRSRPRPAFEHFLDAKDLGTTRRRARQLLLRRRHSH